MTTRRSLLKAGLGAGLGSLSAAAIGGRVGVCAARAAPALQKHNVVIPTASVFVLNYLGGKDAGIFAKHGIDLEVDVRPFAGFLAGLPSKQSMAGNYSGISDIQKINEGLDWAIIGPGLTVVQDVIVRKDSPYKTVADLRGKKFGAFSTGAGAFKAARAAIIDAYKIDVLKDSQFQQVAGPALNKLLERGQLEAMINISSLTMAAEAEPEKFRVLFSPNEYWKEKTGYPIVWASPLAAWRSWVDADKRRARNFAAAAVESFKWLEQPENLETAVKNHGPLAAVRTPGEVDEYKLWLQKKQVFLTSWDQKAVDAQWKFLDLCQQVGIIKKVPAQDKYALFVGELGS
jgi:ABC-type nitrate/sulfonate/bicarbonate transport system substrate-binding protein